MTIIKILKTNKNYNGLDYVEHKLYCVSNGNNVIVTCTGSTSLVVVHMESGTTLDDTTLGKYELKNGDEIIVWRNEYNGKVQQIDLLLSDEVPLS